MSLLAQLVIALAIFVAGAAGGIRWHAGQDAIEAQAAAQQAAKERARQFERIDVAAVGHEKDKVRIQTEFVVITEKVEHALHASDFYADAGPACLDAAGLSALAAAVRAAPSPSQSAPAVQGLKPAHWWQPRRDAEVVR
jgi:hypothetical protein